MRLKESELCDSTLELSEDAFNCCPGRDAIKSALDENLKPYFFLDIESDNAEYKNWKNAEDTVVIGISGIDEDCLRAGVLAVEYGVDEFKYEIVPILGGVMTILVFWWD